MKRFLRGPIFWILIATLLLLIGSSLLSDVTGPRQVDTSAMMTVPATRARSRTALLVDVDQRIEVEYPDGSKKFAEYIDGQGVELQERCRPTWTRAPLESYNVKVPQQSVPGDACWSRCCRSSSSWCCCSSS